MEKDNDRLLAKISEQLAEINREIKSINKILKGDDK